MYSQRFPISSGYFRMFACFPSQMLHTSGISLCVPGTLPCLPRIFAQLFWHDSNISHSIALVANLILDFSGVKTEEIRKGTIFGGVQGYLESICGDPSLTQVQGEH